MSNTQKNNFRDCPKIRPEITIKPSRKPLDTVDSKELRWWGIIPLPGEKSVMAIYDLPNWTLSSVTELKVAGTGTVHGVQGMVINQEEWSKESDWKMEKMRVMGRLTDDCAQWLAMLTDYDGSGDGMSLTTFLDDGFQAGFPDMPRLIADTGNWSEPEPDQMTVKGISSDHLGTWGAGTFDVTIGDKTTRCLRVLECALNARSTFIEAFLDETCRTILQRRFNGFKWQVKDGQETWDKRLEGQRIITVNGVPFIYWYDCLFG